MADEIVFPPHRGLPTNTNPPAVDGFCEWELWHPSSPDPTHPEIETGWTGAARVTYGGASGFPVMSFQALRHNTQDLIYLSFVVRLDRAFDDNDAIYIVFQQDFSDTAHSANTRRLIVRPIIAGVGAGVGAEAYSITSDGETIAVRTNGPVNEAFAKWDPVDDGSWTPMPNPSAYECRSRSWTKIGIGEGDDYNWSVEVVLPASKALGGDDWIDLTATGFGFYFNVFRFSTPTSVVAYSSVTEFSWPPGHVITDTDGGPFAAIDDIKIPPARMGRAMRTGEGVGVQFDGGWGSIGIGSDTSPSYRIDGAAGVINSFFAKLKNTGPDMAGGVNAEFRIADFGIASGRPADWTRIDPRPSGTNPGPNNVNPTLRVTIPATTGTATLRMNWELNGTDRTKYTGHTHQCIWALLNSDADAHFAESSFRVNMNFINLSAARQTVTINTRGYGRVPAATPVDVVLFTSTRLLASTEAYDGWRPSPQGGALVQEAAERVPALARSIYRRWAEVRGPVVTWLAVVTAYRRTGATLTIGKKRYPVTELMDSYSHVMTHVGRPDRLRRSLFGEGLKYRGPGIFELAVAPKAPATLRTRHAALDPNELFVTDKVLTRLERNLAVLDHLEHLRAVVVDTAAKVKELLVIARRAKWNVEATRPLVGLGEQLTWVRALDPTLDRLRNRMGALEKNVGALDRVLDRFARQRRDAFYQAIERGGSKRAAADKLWMSMEAMEYHADDLEPLAPLLERCANRLEGLRRALSTVEALQEPLRGLQRLTSLPASVALPTLSMPIATRLRALQPHVAQLAQGVGQLSPFDDELKLLGAGVERVAAFASPAALRAADKALQLAQG